jgi:hypothetical protein
MNEAEPDEGSGIGFALFVIVLIPLLLAATWLFIVFNVRYRTCVQLENGLNLGYEAVFDLSSTYLKPTAVPRFSDGTPLIRNDMWAIYVTDTTIYGRALGDTSDEDYDYAWRADSDLILKDENPTAYARLIREAGHANWDIDIGSVGTKYLLDSLIDRPEFDAKLCPTALVTW